MKKLSIFLLTAFLFVSLLSAITGATTWHEFPDFETEGELIGGEYVYTMEILDAVPSYLNSSSNGGYGSGASYYQCTEYIARYLYSQFGTDYTDQKDIDDDNTQGFVGDDFHPNYSGSPPQPTIDRGNDSVRLRKVTVPKTGDIVIDTDKNHSAIVQSIDGITIDLVEQNWIWNDSGTYKYTTDRTINTNDSNTYFYRFDPVGYYTDGWHSDGSSQTIFEAYVANGYTDLGGPCDHGGGERVHEYTFVANGNNVTVHLQDLAKDDNCTDNQTTLSYRPGDDEAYLLQGCLGYLWWQYQNLLGAPESDEIDDTSQFPENERNDGFDIMQIFQFGYLFWDQDTGLVRLNCNHGTCEEDNISLCLPGQSAASSFNSFEISELSSQLNSTVPTCAELSLNSGLDPGPWPVFQHDARRSGQSSFQGVDGPILKWTYQIPEGAYGVTNSASVDSYGTIYIGSYGSGDYYLFYAINPNGTLKWRTTEMTLEIATSSAAISLDGTIYIGDTGGDLYAINPDGTTKWTLRCGASSFRSSPVIGPDSTIYIGRDLNAVNTDGTLKWYYPTGSSWSSPALGLDGTIYAGSFSDGHLYAINPDGQLKWRTPIKDRVRTPIVSTDGTIYVPAGVTTGQGSSDGYIIALWPDGTIKWEYYLGINRRVGDLRPLTISLDGRIHATLNDGTLCVFNSDGTLYWERQIGAISSPILDLNATIYIVSEDKLLYAINPDGTTKWTYYLNSPRSNSPTIGSDGTIYIGSGDGYLHAIGIPEGKGGIYGKVTDMLTDEPLSDVEISAVSQSALSKSDGSYSIIIDPGVHDINAVKSGYQSIVIDDVIINSDQSTELNIELTVPGPLNIITTELPPAEIGIALSERIRISGGIYPYQYSIAYGTLPLGLSLDNSYGFIEGIPTTVGSYTFAVAVEDSQTSYAEREFTIEVTEMLTILTESALIRGTQGASYFNFLEATGGAPPYTFSKVGGSVPPGINLYSDGELSGTSSSTGLYQFTVEVTDSSDRTEEKLFDLEIVDPLVITTSTINDGIVGEAYNQTMSASGGYGTYNWQIFSGDLPIGLILDSASGIISGTPAGATLETIVVYVTDEDGRIAYKDYNLQISEPLQILTTTLPNGLRDSQYSELIRVNGGIGPYDFSYTGQLPAGLTLDSTTGIIFGVPTIAGFTNVGITVTDSTYPTSQSVTQNLGIRITSLLTITTSAVLPNAQNGVAINSIILAAGGGPSPYVWSLFSGSLPNGINLNTSTGEIFGTPLTIGDYIFTIQVTDDNSNSAEKEFFWHISDSLVLQTDNIPDTAKGIPYSFSLSAVGGLRPYYWRIKAGALPPGLSLNGSTGTISGTPTIGQIANFTIEVNDNDSPAQITEKNYTMEILDELYIHTTTVPNGRIDQAYTTTLNAKLGTPPYSWRIENGNLPPGLVFTSSPTVGRIEGTPTTEGIYNFTLEATDSDSPAAIATQDYTIEIYSAVVIQTSDLLCAYRGSYYSDTIEIAGGASPYYCEITAGTLPTGLSLNANTGEISGTTDPLFTQSSAFTIMATDSGDPAGFDEKELTIYVINPLETFASYFGESACSGNCSVADYNGDGDVDGYDLYEMIADYGNCP